MEQNKGGLNGYEAGRTFYESRIAELNERAAEVTTPFEALEIQDQRELMELKLMQLNRREQILEPHVQTS